MKIKKLTLIIVFSLTIALSFGKCFSQPLGNDKEYSLYQNNPNPFNETTTVKFSLKEDCYVKLYVTEEQTGNTFMLADGEMTAGPHGVIFKASVKTGSGSENQYDYICTLESYSLVGGALICSSRIKMKQQ